MNLLKREKQYGRFPERISTWMLLGAVLGSAWVLIDPYIALQTTIMGVDWSFKIGGVPFSAELKGGVVTIGILGTIVALQNHWIPSKDAGNRGSRPEPTPQPEPPKEIQ